MIFVPTILFLTVVAPIWIVMHYRYKTRQSRGMSMEERENLEHLLADVDKLADRVSTLESILNEKHDDWRSNSRKSRSQEEQHVSS